MRVHVNGKTYTITQEDMSNDELIDVEEYTGWSLDAWGEKLSEGSMKALTALVWICRKREEPELEFHQVRFKLGQIAVDRDDEDEGDEGEEGKDEAPSPEMSTST